MRCRISLSRRSFLREQVLPLRFERTLVGDIEQGEQDFSPVVFIPYLTRVYEQRAHAHRGKMVLYLVPFDGRILRNHLFEKGAQRGNAPLAVVEVVKKFALRIFVRQSEFFIERAACGDDAQLLIQNNQWLADGVDDGSREQVSILRVTEWVKDPLVCIHIPTVLLLWNKARHMFMRKIH